MKLILPLACLGCALGTYLFIATHSIYIASIGRFLIGLCSSIAFVGTLKIDSLVLPEKQFPIASGITLTVALVAGMVGENLLASVVKIYGWKKMIYWGFILPGCILPILMYRLIEEPTNLLYKLGSNETINSLFKDLKKLLINPMILLTGFISFLLHLSLAGFAELWGPKYLEKGLGFTHRKAILASSMVLLGWAIGSPVVGWLADKFNKRVIIIRIGAFISAISIGFLILCPINSIVLASMLLLGYGCFSAGEILTFTLSKEYSPPSLVGTSMALTNFISMLSGLIFQPLIGKMLATFTHEMDSAKQFGIIFLAFPVCALGAVGLTFFLKETYGKSLYAKH